MSILFLVGPTAIGKTKIAILLARKINAEIISCDSMQVYKGMDILTSKPARLLRKTIPYHLIDVIPATKEYNVSQYRKDALRKVKEIYDKGKNIIFTGGTGLYMTILIDGIFEEDTPKTQLIRKRLYREAEKFGSQSLYEKLNKIDSLSASKIHPNDTKRIIRALEVFEATGKPISLLQKQRKGLSNEYDIKIFCLNMEREKLYIRIDARVDKMFKQGLFNEAKNILRKKLSKTASYAIGIRELEGYFQGRYPLEEAKAMIKRNTRLYAKRQLTWFRKDKRIHWVEVGAQETPREVAQRLWKELCLSA